MATGRAPSTSGSNTPQARVGIDLSQLRNAPNIARQAGQATAREIQNAFRTLQNEQRIAIQQAQQTTAAVRAQQAQITATSRAESQQRIQQARAESVTQQQAARAATATVIEEEKRKTAAFNAEIRAREREQSVSQGSGINIGGIGQQALGAFGIGLGVGGVIQLGRQADELARASAQAERTRQSFGNLAAGVGQSANSMLADMRKASKGLVADSDLVLSANRAMLLGVAQSGDELAQLLEVARVRGQAMGESTTDAFNDIVTGIGRLSPRILDNLGIIVDEQQAYEIFAQSLGRTADSLTDMERKQALLNAILKDSAPLVDAAGTAADNAADKYERLDTAQKNFAEAAGTVVKDAGEGNIDMWTRLTTAATGYLNAINQIQRFGFTNNAPLPPLLDSAANRMNRSLPPPRNPNSLTQAQRDVYLDRYQSRQEVGTRERSDLSDATRSFGRQQAKMESDYQISVLREAEDFARKRLNQERKFNLSLLDVAQDSARQRVKWEADMQRTINDQRQERDERIADAREDSAKRIAKMEEDYEKDRLRRAQDLSDQLLDAAGQLDAKQVYELQRNAAREEKQAQEQHQEQIDNERESLQERIDDANDAFDKFERQQHDSLQRRLDEQAENDALRLEEMKQAFADQKAQEDTEREIDLGRRADDHARQVAEQNSAQAERIQQIKDHAKEQRDEIDEQFKKDLAAVGIYVDGYKKEINRIVNEAILSGRRFIKGIIPQAVYPGHPSEADPYVDRVPPISSNTSTSSWTQTNNARHVTVQPGAIVVQTHPNMSRNEILGIMTDLIESLDQ